MFYSLLAYRYVMKPPVGDSCGELHKVRDLLIRKGGSHQKWLTPNQR